MNRRYQVFVSSTYTDLIEARAEVMQALLELDCMPAGMELFPAASEEQWSWIKRVIDESDYYVVIVGGRYGSVSERTGLSFTEMEYRYALEAGKPTIAFLHEAPSNIPSGKVESTPQLRRKLQLFRQLLEQKLCKYWSSPSDLGAKVSRGVTQLIKHHPAIGWIRADQVPEDQTREILALRRELEIQAERLRAAGISDGEVTQSLARGKDKFSIEYVCEIKGQKHAKNGRPYWVKESEHEGRVKISWDEIFMHLASEMHSATTEFQLLARVNRLIERHNASAFERSFPGKRVEYVRIRQESWDTIKLQLRALGLIEASGNDAWELTGEGEAHLIRLKAVHRPQ